MEQRTKLNLDLNSLITSEEYEIIEKIRVIAHSIGANARIVGGFVRDKIRLQERNSELQKKEIDFVTTSSSFELAKKIAEQFHHSKFYQYGHFGTARVDWRDWQFEFAQARKESYHPESRNPTVTPTTFDEDLARRDFTVNAMAWGITGDENGILFDLFNGLQDLKQGVLRTPSNPLITFSDDPLRMMRAVRFASKLNFSIAPETLVGMQQSAHRISIVHQERITDEFLQLMKSPRPSYGIRILEETGVLAFIIPELIELKGIDQVGKHGHKDVWNHTLKVLDNASEATDDMIVRLAALFHDIAKPKTKKFISDLGWTFYGHEILGAKMIRRIFQRLKIPNHIEKKVSQITSLHMRPVSLVQEGVTDSAVRRLRVVAEDEIDRLLLLCKADITSKNPNKIKNYLKNYELMKTRIEEIEIKDKLQSFQSPVRGDEIAQLCKIPFGPRIGQMKSLIESAILDGIIPNEYEEAKSYLLKMKDEWLTLPERQTQKRKFENLSEEQLQRALQEQTEKDRTDGKPD